MFLKEKLQKLKLDLEVARSQHRSAQQEEQFTARVIKDTEDLIVKANHRIYEEIRLKAEEERLADFRDWQLTAKAKAIEAAERQRRWNMKTQRQQAEILLAQLNKTMGLYKKSYEKLSKEGLQMLRNWQLLSTPLDRDLENINDEIPF